VLDPFNAEGGVPLSFNLTAGTSPLVNQTTAEVDGTLRFVITGLDRGQQYFVRVTAANSLGVSAATGVTTAKWSSPFGITGIPTNVEFLYRSPASATPKELGTSLVVRWSPGDDGGNRIRDYIVEWATSPFSTYIQEVQTVTVNHATATASGFLAFSLDTSAWSLSTRSRTCPTSATCWFSVPTSTWVARCSRSRLRSAATLETSLRSL
jgi:hypothetical protein